MPLSIEDIDCIHIKPNTKIRNDSYKNLILLSKDIQQFVVSPNVEILPDEIYGTKITVEMKEKINKLRVCRNLKEIQFKTI